MKATSWKDLIVYGDDGTEADTLGNIVSDPLTVNMLDNRSVKIVDGAIAEWTQVFIAAPGEEYDWDTPRGAVDWTGFIETLESMRSISND